MGEITCILGKKIKFTKERYLHIILRHPELAGKEGDIRKTLTDTDFVQERKVLLYGKNKILL